MLRPKIRGPFRVGPRRAPPGNMDKPALSVVIPTRNRRLVLGVTLTALNDQTGMGGTFEVIVVDDGSEDDTTEWLACQTFEAFEMKTLRTDGIGPAGARNLGISQAQADRVLLLGDDTIPQPTTLKAHLTLAGGRDIGVQGRIDWDPSLEITPVMHFLAPEGPQFWFKGLGSGDPVPFTGVYGSNLSAPTKWFLSEPFDETYRSACFEDTEQAWRWSRRGWGVVFGDLAVCYHRHHYESLDPVIKRQRRAGVATRHTLRKHPRLLWTLFLQPLMVGGFKAVEVGGKFLFGRATFADRADLRCRLAWLGGLFTSITR